MAFTELAICNMALSRCGIGDPLVSGDGATGTIAATTSTEVAADLCKTWYPLKRAELLESYPWPFALKYADLAGETAGTSQPWGDEWRYKFTYPSDCARLWRFARTDMPPSGSIEFSSWLMASVIREDPEYQYAVRSVSGVKVILAHLEAARARMIYTLNAPAVGDFSPLFASALAWSLTAELALPLSAGTTRANEAQAQFYSLMLPLAISAHENEQGLQGEADGSYISSRWGC